MRIEDGKVYRIDISMQPDNYPVGRFETFEFYDGHEISNINIEQEDEYSFFYDGWFFTKDVLVEVEGKRAERILKEDPRTYTNFKKGDLVRFRTIEDLKQHYYFDNKFIYTIPIRFDYRRHEFVEATGKKAIIKEINKEGVVIVESQDKEGNLFKYTNYCTEMLEIVEEGYEQRVEEELKAKRIKKTTDVDNDEIIKEMLSKVDIEKFKKILTGALRVKATSLKGVDKLLNDWACNKKDIYLALGRNLTIRKSIEYTMDSREIYSRRKELTEKFPRFPCNII